MGVDDQLDGEVAIIAEFLAPLTGGDAGAAGLLDDVATLTPEPGIDLVVTTDSLIEGVHFLAGDIPSFKAVAVNISDLIAKGATPRAYLLTLALSDKPTRQFMAQLVEGLAASQQAFGCRLIGGDTDRTPGPFTLTVTAIGEIGRGRIVRRDGARAGDLLVVTGTIGDAALGLALRKEPSLAGRARLSRETAAGLIARFDRPVPRLEAAQLVSEFAHAAMDVSDGLVKDLERLVATSGAGADVNVDRIPISPGARAMLDRGVCDLAALIGGGEDYEVLMAIAPERWADVRTRADALGVPVTQIGSVRAQTGIAWRNAAGHEFTLGRRGWDHFR